MRYAVLPYLKIIFYFLFSLTVYSEEKVETTFEYTQKIKKNLEDLEKLDAKNYIQEIDRLRNDIEKYLAHKLRVCRGEFSTLILSEDEAKKKGKLRLSKKEKHLCLQELKAIYILFVENLYTVRQKYLKLEFEKREEELSKIRDGILSEIKKGLFPFEGNSSI